MSPGRSCHSSGQPTPQRLMSGCRELTIWARSRSPLKLNGSGDQAMARGDSMLGVSNPRGPTPSPASGRMMTPAAARSLGGAPDAQRALKRCVTEGGGGSGGGGRGDGGASGSGTGRIGGASGGGGIVGGIGGTDGLAEGGGEGGRGGCDGGRGDGTNGGDIGGSGGGNAGGVSGGSTGIATVTLEAAPKATGSLDKTKRAIAIMLRAPSDRAHIAPLRRQWENSPSPGSPSSFSSSSSSSPSTSSSSSASTTSALLIPAGTTCLFWFRVVLFLLTKKEACGSSLSNASASLPFP